MALTLHHVVRPIEHIVRPIELKIDPISINVGGSIGVYLSTPPCAGYVMVTASYEGFSVSAKGTHMAYTLPIDHGINVQVAYLDSAGNPASVDGDTAWSSSDESKATVVADANDSTMAAITPVAVGTAQILATVDADLGAGVRTLIVTLDLSLVGGEAVAGTINVVGDPFPLAPTPTPVA
jgi:hypothetical protein